jgi:hypothetical protein
MSEALKTRLVSLSRNDMVIVSGLACHRPGGHQMTRGHGPGRTLRLLFECSFDHAGHAVLMPAYPFEHKPERCPFGHVLDPGLIQIGWSPCICVPAKEAAARGRGMGHLRLYCLACEEKGRTAIFFEPPHDLKQWHVRLGMRSYIHSGGPTAPKKVECSVFRAGVAVDSLLVASL